MAETILLRAVSEDDLAVFFAQQLDPEANHMAAFTSRDPSDWDLFLAHWRSVLADPANTNRTIEADGQVAGHLALYPESETEYDLGYWLGREFWGRGIATAALGLFLAEIARRPLYARVAKDNVGSRRVLEKNGFRVVGEEREYANARNAFVDEYVLRLD